MEPLLTVLNGDAITQLTKLPDRSVQCCVTSPPYWGLRDYGCAGQLGLEKTPEEYVCNMVQVFREVRRVLKDDGTLWLNLGDTYNQGNKGNSGAIRDGDKQGTNRGSLATRRGENLGANCRGGANGMCKSKDLVGIPWMVAFALRADGWYLRSDIIWHKPNPMPESVTDRPTKSHEYLFLLTKSQRYYYDAEAIAEPVSDSMMQQIEEGYDGLGLKDYATAGVQNPSSVKTRIIENARKKQRKPAGWDTSEGAHGTIQRDGRAQEVEYTETESLTRNKRSVWTVPTYSFPDAHFATFPPDLIKPCILAGSKAGDTILDPFGGSGTTGMVALELGRKAVLIELNSEYVKLIETRCDVTPGLALA
jgi:DNA modification methylase